MWGWYLDLDDRQRKGKKESFDAPKKDDCFYDVAGGESTLNHNLEVFSIHVFRIFITGVPEHRQVRLFCEFFWFPKLILKLLAGMSKNKRLSRFPMHDAACVSSWYPF